MDRVPDMLWSLGFGRALMGMQMYQASELQGRSVGDFEVRINKPPGPPEGRYLRRRYLLAKLPTDINLLSISFNFPLTPGQILR